MLYPGLPFLLLLALVAVVLLLRKREWQENANVLRHTIAVNLEILESELAELLPLTAGTPPSTAQEEAFRLLKQAEETAASARARLYFASNFELEEMLGQVFAAMINSTDARLLLDARRPRS